MGNKSTSKNQNPDQDSSEKNEVVVNHPKFKKLQFFNNYQFMRIELPIDNIKSFKKWEDLYSELDFYEDQYLLLPRTCSFSKSSLCGDSGIVQIQYENFHYLLNQQLENRIPHQEFLNEKQIWYLFYGLISSSASFYKINSKVGDIRPRNIFLNDVGQVKIANRCSWPQQKNNYQKMLIDEEVTFIAPEQFQHLKSSNLNTDIDIHVAEAFSIGLTMLETILLEQCTSLYCVDFKDLKNAKFDDRRLFEKLTKLWSIGFEDTNKNFDDANSQISKEKGYSWQLKFAISALCQLNPKDRVSANILYSWLSPHQTQIINIQELTEELGQPPLKNIKKYQAIRQKIENGEFLDEANKSKIHRLHGKGLSNFSLNSNQEIGHLSNASYMNPSTSQVNSQTSKIIWEQKNYPIYTQPVTHHAGQIKVTFNHTEHNTYNQTPHNFEKSSFPSARYTYAPSDRPQNYKLYQTPASFSFSQLSSIKQYPKGFEMSNQKEQQISFNNEFDLLKKINNRVEQSKKWN